MTLTMIATFITEIGILLGVVKWVATTYRKNADRMERVAEGVKCQLRSDMLHIYYQYKDAKKIRQYELENFLYLYKAYKSLHGNSFIDKIQREVLSWEVIT